ncbi:polysaccharide deacetylase family protein [Labilibacter marinus]|uniref:polysaccharide deacetylase family protein n=1 Tax=Labilibacter marinus TaxID=1477105 RepID=UPI00094FC9C7|nr:polysaccharide deacetylase family protein [Labilibacter marinus]
MVRPPFVGRLMLPGATWRLNHQSKDVYVTFDDGPIPEITPWVLDEADKWNAKLTFFCVGENVHKHPAIFKEVINRGHAVGNHTYNHLKAWNTERSSYFENIDLADQVIHSKIFRPPYGQLYPWDIKPLRSRFDKVVMWDILSKDYDTKLSGEQVYKNIENHIRPGSIIVFHDSLKAEQRMKYAFPKTLELIAQKGYITRVIK